MKEALKKFSVNCEPEMKLLLACISIDTSHDSKNLINAISQRKLHWEKFLGLCQYHEVLGIVYLRLVSGFKDYVPEFILIELKYEHENNCKKCLLISASLIGLVGTLRKNTIRAVCYKGPVLSYINHKDISVRQYCDIDFLVEEKDVELIRKVMIQLGFEEERKIKGWKRNLYQWFECENNFFKVDTGPWVEIHHKILPRLLVIKDSNEIWLKETEWIVFVGSKIEVPRQENSLLILCLHGSKHLWCKLKWSADLYHFLKSHPGLDWSYIEVTSKHLGIERLISIGLNVVRHLYDLELTGRAMTIASRADDMYAIETCVADSIDDTSNGKRTSNKFVRRQVFNFFVHKNFIDKVTYLMWSLPARAIYCLVRVVLR